MIEQATIEQWLQDAGIESAEIEAEPASEYAWALGFKAPLDVAAAHKAVEHNHLLMQLTLNVSEEHEAALRALGDEEREDFNFALRIALLERPVGYQLTLAEDNDTVLKQLTFGINVYEDPLQRAGFFRRNHQLQSAALLAAVMVRRLAQLGKW